MKILELRFKNLNSLYGEWCIDFTDPAFAEDGLFAITGPTGSGKTTVLDAICLALYGQTPRLGKMTQSDNEVMSRQTGECFAEVLFEAASGTYRASWHQHRSRKKADGALQAAKREIAQADGTILAEKIKEVDEQVERISGMSFDRFTRSILLAQGSFDTFLKASADERSPILEQITGTEIYTEISKTVHERNSAENQKLKELTAALGGIQLLSEEELEQIIFDKGNVEEKHREEAKKRDAAKAALDAQDRIQKLEQELEINGREKATWTEDHKAFQPENEKLTASRRAQPLDVSHVKLVNLRNSRTKIADELTQSVKALPELEALRTKAQEVLKQSEIQLTEQEAEQQKWSPILKQVRELDTQITERSATLVKEETELKTEEAELQALRETEKTNLAKLEQLQQKQAEARVYQEQHAQDAELVGQLAAILQSLKLHQKLEIEKKGSESAVEKADSAAREAVKVAQYESDKLASTQKRSIEAETVLTRIIQELEAALNGKTAADWRTRLEELRKRRLLEQQISDAGQTIEEKAHEAGDTAKELSVKRKEQEALQREQSLLLENLQLQEKLKSLESHRDELVDGKPCPLCGALEHPFATHLPKPETRSVDKVNGELKTLSELINELTGKQSAAKSMVQSLQSARQKDEAELQNLATGSAEKIDEIQMRISTIEKLEQAQATAKATLEQAREKLNQQKLIQQTAEQTAQTAANKLSDSLQRKSESSTAFNESESTLIETLAPYGIKDITEATDQLTARRDQWLKSEKQQATFKEALSTIKTTIAEQAESLKKQEFRLVEQAEQLKEQHAAINSLKADRNDLFGDQQADAVEQNIQQALLTARTVMDSAKTTFAEQNQQVSLANQKIDKLNESQKETVEQLAKEEPEFIEKLTTAGFDTEEAYLSARLSLADQAELEKRADELKQRHTSLMALETEKTNQLQTERKQKHIETSPEEHAVLVATCDDLQQQIGEFKSRLEADVKSRSLQSEKLAGIEKQKTECVRWNTLHELIGSADGKKFRNFAQGLTFELMVSQANRQLSKMSDRYLLIRDKNQPLDLNVVDNYQAGEIRPVKNLSGGESFIVSLSLALGLSKMASHTIRVDSLFLDEGFGTLDEDALETALEALAELKQDGKIIGVISHVGALKERIGTQINLHPASGGRSQLSGTGVSTRSK